MSNDELKEFEQREDRKWSNLQRIQQRMAARQKVRKAPRQTEFKKKKKLKNIENPEWKKKFEEDRAAKEKAIADKYKEDMKRKKKLEKQKKAKEQKILKKKWDEEAKINKSGLSKPPPDTKKWAQNFAKQQLKTQQQINEKYEIKKQKDDQNRKIFKIKAAAIEKKYDDKKPKKKKRDPNKKAIIIDAEHNAFTAVENNDFDLLDRIYTFYPNDIKKKDKQGNTILHHAIKHYTHGNNTAPLIEFLVPKLPISYMSSVNFLGNPPMMLGVFERKFECMRALYSADMKRRPDLDHLNINGRTALMRAAMRDDDELIEFLLKECNPRPDIDMISEKHGKSALTYAVEHNKVKAVKMLVEAGANYYIKNKLGKTAYDMAKKKCLRIIIKQDRVNVVKGLVQSGMIRRYNIPDYLMAIISEYCSAVPQWVLDEEEKERQDALEKKKKKKKKKKGGRGRGRS